MTEHVFDLAMLTLSLVCFVTSPIEEDKVD